MYLRAKRYAFVAVDQVGFALLPYVCGACATRKTLQCPSVSTRCRRRALRKHFEARPPAQALNLDALPPHPSPHEGAGHAVFHWNQHLHDGTPQYANRLSSRKRSPEEEKGRCSHSFVSENDHRAMTAMPPGPLSLWSIKRYYRILLNVKNCSTGKLYGTVPPSVGSAFMIM